MLDKIISFFKGDPNIKNISGNQLNTLIKERNVHIIDVRSSGEYAGGHLPNAKNYNVNSPDFGSKLMGMKKDAVYVVYCQSGMRSRRAASLMSAAGFGEIYDLGGIGNWQGKIVR